LGAGKFVVLNEKLIIYIPIDFYAKLMTCGGGQLGFSINTKNENFVTDHQISMHV
jgi:hypothetical protein